MRTRIGRRLLSLVLVPLIGLVLVLGVFAILEMQTQTTESWLLRSDSVIEQSQAVALDLARARPVPTIVREFASLRALVSDDPSQLARLKLYARAAVNHMRHPENARGTARLTATQGEFDDFEATLQHGRRAASDRLRALYEIALGLAIVIAFAATFTIYRALSGDVTRRLEALAINTQRYWTGEPIGPPDEAGDEISEVDARFRLAFEMLANRETAASRYKVLAEETSDIMFFLDGTKIVEANAAAFRTYGYAREELLRLSVFDLRVPEEHETVANLLKIPENSVESYETFHRKRDGTRFPVEIMARKTGVANGRLLFIVARDISARRESDARLRAALLAANEASRLKSEFVATMSHEIRTPMNAILGMTELLLDSTLDFEQRDLASTVRSSGQSLLRIIDDVLDFSKIEAGKLVVETRSFNLTSCVEAVAHLLAPQLQRKRLLFNAFVPPEFPARLLGDEMRIRQVLTNLLGNATKFTATGSVSIACAIRAQTKTDVTIRFEVTDTGIGLEPTAAKGLFTAFTQADGSITRRYGGTGLGLAISKRLVELMGGTIGVQSKPALGSTFWFEIPFAISDEKVPPPRSVACGPILVVDTHRPARDILTRYLRAWSIEVDEAASLESAISLCAQRTERGTPYALVFFDHAVDTPELASIVRYLRLSAHAASLPVVLTSFSETNETSYRAVQSGFCAVLTKPLRQSVLFDCISTFTKVAEPDIAFPVAPEPQFEAMLTRGHVLLVEDNIVNQHVGRKQLEKLGFAVTCADNGRIAVDVLETERYDLVFMDVQMPEMDGFAATRAIRRNERAANRARVPIVALTADARTQDRTACLESGMDDYLSKPVALTDLRAVLARWLRVTA